ncbi:MAG: protein-L-isoaspartate O-methyltransferase [Rhodospirillales bacterium]
MDFDLARRNMVESQIRPNRVTDMHLIEAMESLPREAFVPADLQGVAYTDTALSLSDGRFLMEPMVMARLIQAASPGPSDLALSVGCGTGYGPAVLAKLVGTVVAVESDSSLAQHTQRILSELGIDTVAVVEDDFKTGCPAQGPYDVIYFDGAVDEIPRSIAEQLAEGGRLVAVVLGRGTGRAMLMTRHQGVLSSVEVFDATTVRLPGFEPPEKFVF